MPARKPPVGCVDRGFDSYGSDGSGALEDLIRVVGVAELAVVHPPIATGADEIVVMNPGCACGVFCRCCWRKRWS